MKIGARLKSEQNITDILFNYQNAVLTQDI